MAHNDLFRETIVKVMAEVRTTGAWPEQQSMVSSTMLAYRPKILVVGCGGTGGWVVPQAARLLKAARIGSLALADGDTVEPRNLIRQNFIETDLGQNKAVVLAKRYGAAFGFPIRAVPGFLSSVRGLDRQGPDIVIGCVDRHEARRLIAEWYSCQHNAVWIDSGNESVAGQVVLGYNHFNAVRTVQSAVQRNPRNAYAVKLPCVSQLYNIHGEQAARPSCAEMVEVADQVSSVNQVAATLVTNFLRLVIEDVVRRNVRRQPAVGIEYHAVNFNVKNGAFSTRWNTLENLADAEKPIAPWR